MDFILALIGGGLQIRRNRMTFGIFEAVLSGALHAPGKLRPPGVKQIRPLRGRPRWVLEYLVDS